MVDIYNFINELTKFELIFKDEKGIPHCYRSHIKSVTDDKILIAPPISNGKAVNLEDGLKIKIVISTESGVYTAESDIIGKEFEFTPGLWIRYPYNAKHSQRREYLRAPLDIDFELVITPDKKDEKKVRKQYKVKNISGKGLSFISDEPLKNYYEIEVRIDANDEVSVPVKTKCEHIYSNQYEVSGLVKYVHALAFIDITEASSERIIKQCFKYQLESRKKAKYE